MELLDRVRARDKDAFEELMNEYGAKLYARLLSRLGDRALADKAFKETMIDFFRLLSREDCEDATEALLTERIDREAEAIAESSLQSLIAETAQNAEKTARPEGQGGEAEEGKCGRRESAEDAEPAEQSGEAGEAKDAALPDARGRTETKQPEASEQDGGDAIGGYGETEKKEKKRRGKTGICLVLLIAVFLMLLWVTVGGLMTAGVLPFYDLGYGWLHANILPVFG